VHAETELVGRVAAGQRDELGQVQHRHMQLLAGALQRRLVEVELLKTARAHYDERIHIVGLQVQQLAARELERRRALADAVESAAATLHLRGVVDDGGAQGGHDALDLGGRQRIVPAHRRLEGGAGGSRSAPPRAGRRGS